MSGDTIDIFLNAAMTHKGKTNLLKVIKDSNRHKRINIFVSLAGFTKSGLFNNKNITNLKTNPDDNLPSNCRYTPTDQELSESNIPSMISHQNEITDSTFDFFNEIGVLQAKNRGKFNILFLGMTRNTRPLSCIVGLTEDGSELEFYANVAVLDKNSDIKKLKNVNTNNQVNKKLTPFNDSESLVQEILQYCENNLKNRTDIYYGISEPILKEEDKVLSKNNQDNKSKARRFNKLVDTTSSINKSTEDDLKEKMKEMKVTFLADLMTVAAAMKFKEDGGFDGTFIREKTVTPIKLQCTMKKKFGKRTEVVLPSFVQEGINQKNTKYVKTGTSFICHYLNEPSQSHEIMEYIELAHILLTYAHKFLKIGAVGIFKELHILCDDLVNDFDDLLIRHRFSTSRSSEYFYYPNNPITDKLLRTDNINKNTAKNTRIINSKMINVKGNVLKAALEAVSLVKHHESKPPAGGKRGGKKKKVRKHVGIVQTGGNAGRLKKGYKYSGERLANGMSKIVKV